MFSAQKGLFPPLTFILTKLFFRYTDPEPSDNEIVKKKEYKLGENCEGRHYHSSREHLERHRSPRDDDRQRSSAEESDRQRSREDLSRNRNRSSRDNFIRQRSTTENLDRQRSGKEDVRYKASKEDLRYKSPDPKDSDGERKYRETDFVGRCVFFHQIKDILIVTRYKQACFHCSSSNYSL